MAADQGPRWRVFISHTSELRKYPHGGSYIDPVERAVSLAGHVIVDMGDFPFGNAPPAEKCLRCVQDRDVFLGILDARYGPPARNRPETSDTEPTYDTATKVGRPRLMLHIDIYPDWFGDRVVGTMLIAGWLKKPSNRMITVIGRGGIDRTAMLCRLVKALEADRLPCLAKASASMEGGGIPYLSPTGDHEVSCPHLIKDLYKLLPFATTQAIQAQYQDPHRGPAHVLRAVLSFLLHDEGPVIVLLDNLESVLDTALERIAEGTLHETLETVLRTAEHPLKLLVTTRAAPAGLPEVRAAYSKEAQP